MRITDWTVERSGKGLRVIGVNEKGEPVKLTKVARVTRQDGVTVALRDTNPLETALLV